MSLANEYSESIHNNLHMYAAWPINTPLDLGDFGILDGHLFQRLGNIKERFNIKIKSISSKSPIHLDYKSADMIETNLYARGDIKAGVQIPLARAGLEISFSGENAIFFDAAGCNISTIENKDHVFNEILKLYRKGMWNKENTLITEIIRAKSATVLISKSRNGLVFLEADSPEVSVIKLGEASVGLKCTSEKGSILKVISAKDTTPLIKLGRIKNITWPWQDPMFKELAAKSNISEIIEMQSID